MVLFKLENKKDEEKEGFRNFMEKGIQRHH